jgi:hypothetical protein
VEEDFVIRVVDALFRLLGAALRYWVRRTHRHPLVGLLYLVVVLPTLALLVQDGRLAWATLTAPAFTAPDPLWPLQAPLPMPMFGLIALLIGLVVILDRRVALGAERQARKDVPRSAEPVYSPREWVVGRMVARTWQPDPGVWVLSPTNEVLTLTAEHLRVHLLVVAPPGGGKTSSILNPILHLCRRAGGAAIVFDVKGDPEQLDDRPDFDPAAFHLTLDFTHPERSARLNLAAGRSPREVGEQLGEALIYDPGEYKAYFVNNAKDALGGLFAAHATAYQRLPTFRQILAYIRNADARKDLLTQLRTTGATDSSDEVLDLRRIDQLLEGKTDVLGNLDLALAPLARGAVADLLVTDDSGISLADLLREGARVRVVLPVYKYPRVAPIVGRLILAQFMSAVLSPDCNRSRLKVALVDEAHWFVTPSIADGMADVRHNYGSYVLAFQTLPQIGDEILREKIFSIAGNKLVMAGVGDLDAQKFSAIFGAHEQEYVSHSTNTGQSTNTSRTRGRGQHSGGSMFGGVAAGGSQQMSTARSTGLHESEGSNRHTRLRPDWLPSEIRGLPVWHVLMERRDGQGRLSEPTLVSLDRTFLDQVHVRQDLQLYTQYGRLEAYRPVLPNLSSEGRPAPEQVEDWDTYPTASTRAVPSTKPVVPDRLPPTLDINGDIATISAARDATPVPPLHAPAMREGKDWIPAAVELLQTRLGLEPADALILAECAKANGRNLSYLVNLLKYVEQTPEIQQPAAMLRHLVTANQVRRPRPATVQMPDVATKAGDSDS